MSRDKKLNIDLSKIKLPERNKKKRKDWSSKDWQDEKRDNMITRMVEIEETFYEKNQWLT